MPSGWRRRVLPRSVRARVFGGRVGVLVEVAFAAKGERRRFVPGDRFAFELRVGDRRRAARRAGVGVGVAAGVVSLLTFCCAPSLFRCDN